jgi:hypothetical protein
VNVAARLEELIEGGEIFISQGECTITCVLAAA